MPHPCKYVLAFAVLLLSGVSFAGTHYVSATGPTCDGNSAFGSIQEAIDAAEAGDDILVCNDGEYSENVVINRPARLQGVDSMSKTAVSAAVASSPVFSIEADGVTISGFILKDATGSYGLYSTASYADISDVTATNNDIGFYFEGSSHNTLTSNTAHDNMDEGFRLTSGSDHNLLTGNTAYNQQYYGFYLHGSSDNTLLSNTAYNSTLWYGFFLYSNAQDNILENNTAYQNAHHGFHVYMTSDNTLTGNTAYDNSAEGFRLSSSLDNTLTGNTAYDNSAEGFRLSSSHGNMLDENTAYGNSQSGFLVSSSSGNTLTDNTAYGNIQYGFYVLMSQGNAFSSNTAYQQQDGFRIFGSSNNGFTSNDAYGNEMGIYLDLSSDNRLDSNTAHENTEHGFLFSSSSNNNITGNAAYDNGQHGFYGYLGSDNKLSGNTAHGNLNGFRITSSSNNQITDNDAYGNLNGFYLYLSSGNQLSENTANGNSNSGFYLYESEDNTLLDNDAYGNAYYGIYVYLSPDNHLIGNDAYDNLKHGISVSSGSGNLIADNDIYGNSEYGLYLYLSDANALELNEIHENSLVGCHLHASTGTSLEGEHYYGNNIDFGVDASPSPVSFTASGIIFDNPSGDLESCTNISITDVVGTNSTYWISWASQPDALPHPHISFENKFLDIGSPEGTVIDSITWHWLDSEAGPGYDEPKFRVWQHDAMGWLEFDIAPDIGGNTITVSGLSPASTYGILQNRSVPSMTLHSPAPGEVLNTTAIALGWTTYSYDPTSACNITLDGGIVNPSEITAQSGAPNSYPITVQGEGVHQWSVTCADSIGTNTSETRDFTVDLPPAVYLDSPDDEVVNESENDIGFTVYDNLSSVLDCSLYINGTLDQTNGSVQSGVPSGFQVDLDEGAYSLQVICEDESGNTDESGTKELVVDTTPPQIDLISPADGYTGNDQELTFSFTTTDELSDGITSYLFIDGVMEDITTGDQFTLPVSEGTHNWSVLSVDEADNGNMSEVWEFTLDQTAPVITLYSPPYGESIITANPVEVTFSFTATDDQDPAVDCSFYLSGDLNQSGIPIADGEPESLALVLGLGSYYWQVECSDDVGNTEMTSARTLYIGQNSDDDDDDDDDDDGDDDDDDEGDGDQDQQDPEIQISREANCPENTTTFTVSSGPNTFLRLLDSTDMLLDSQTTDSNNQATFAFSESGTYKIRASRASYMTTTEIFYYELCNVTDEEGDPVEENQTELSDPSDGGDDDSGGRGEYSGPGNGVAAGLDTAYAHDVEIIVDEYAYIGDTIMVLVLVDGQPAVIQLELTPPQGASSYLMTNGSGEVTFIGQERGVHNITVAEPDLPRKSAHVEVLRKPNMLLEDYPMALVLTVCTPLFIFLALLLAVMALRSRKRKRGGSRRNYGGYKTQEKEGIVKKMRRIIRQIFLI